MSLFTSVTNFEIDKLNNKILEYKNKRYILKLYLKNNIKPKYMVIRNELALRDSTGNLPHLALQGEDIIYLYTYGLFKNADPLTQIEKSVIYSIFHSSGRIVFGDLISGWEVFRTIIDIETISDSQNKDIVLKVFNDLQKFNWKPDPDLKLNTKLD